MATTNLCPTGTHPTRKRTAKQPIHVDATPMVDLGFLLISFFIFTTTLQSSTAMPLRMPKESNNPNDVTPIKASAAMTIVLGMHNQLYYYKGLFVPNVTHYQVSNFQQIRQVLQQHKQTIAQPECMVIIKPSAYCQYKNVVDILDEITIQNIKRYALVKITPPEAQLMPSQPAVSFQ